MCVFQGTATQNTKLAYVSNASFNDSEIDDLVLKLRDGSVEDLSLERVAALLAAKQEGARLHNED